MQEQSKAVQAIENQSERAPQLAVELPPAPHFARGPAAQLPAWTHRGGAETGALRPARGTERGAAAGEIEIEHGGLV